MTLHAVMTLNLCLESYATAAHVMDSLFGSGVYLGPRRSGVAAESEPQPSVESFAAAVRSATEAMPFDQTHALWLIDVCRCSYDQAALETGTTCEIITARVADGRRFIRASLHAQQLGVKVS